MRAEACGLITQMEKMIIARLAGGLGNQMFQYAAGRRLAYHLGVPLKLDLSAYGPEGDTQAPGLEAFRRHVRLQEFNIAAEQATAAEIAAVRDPYYTSSTKSRLMRRVRKFRPRFKWPQTH